MDFIPISVSQVDLVALLEGAAKALNRSISRGIDERNMPISATAAFIAAIGELIRPGSNPIDVIRSSSGLSPTSQCGEHAHIAFLIHGLDQSVRYEIGRWTELAVTSSPEGLIVASGTLRQWVDAIIALCAPFHSSRDIRLLGGKLMIWFERQGLNELWGDYEKQGLPDKTFILVRKQCSSS